MRSTLSIFFACAILAIFHSGNAGAQCSNGINHWESCVKDNQTWKYIVPAAAIANWNSPSFNDAAWVAGTGGMGYGDGDDGTVVPTNTVSVYMRKTFTIVDTAAIATAVFCMDFDDGFVAYLNGTEIARSNMPVNFIYNTFATAAHEAQLYQGFQPSYFTIPAAAIDTLFKPGNNVLCIETHNSSANNSDLTSRPFMQLGLSNANVNYTPVPAWFTPPFSLYTNLPIISINTNGGTIVDDPRILADMGIIDNGPGNMNCINDPFNNYNGKVQIEIRGASSQSVPKKGYGFTTVDAGGINAQNVSILGMPAENDWVLNATYTDKTFMRDVICYDLARYMGWYTTRVRFVELMLNGEYRGIYILQEKVKQDKNRSDVEKLTPSMNAGDSLTGGYVYKVDWNNGAPGGGWNSNNGVSMQFHDPSVADLTVTQENYLKSFVNLFEADLFGANFTNPGTGYRRRSNPYSFADDFILQEFSNNIDGYRASNYLHKDRDSKCGKFTMGPFWDFNFTFGSPDWCFGENTQGWQMVGGCGNETNTWIEKMLQDQWFKNVLNCRWNTLRQSYLSTPQLFNRIDSMRNYLSQAAVRDSAKWGLVYWPTNWLPNNLQHAVDSMKTWMNLRLTWMDANMYPANQACNAAAGMNLVIDEINFHSDSTTDGGDWLELYNYGNTTLDLSYAAIFDGDGYEKYCTLPNNTTLAAGARLVVYSDSTAFSNQYPGVNNKKGPLCFKLSNSGQKIIIRDKDNKLIYSVDYKDLWQCSTDGNGRTLQLTSPSANPNLSASWYAGCMGGSPGLPYTACTENLIYSEINYNSSIADDAGDWIELHNKNVVAYPLAGWSIRDGSSNNVYTFPANTVIAPNGYLVAYSDATKFNQQHPGIANKIGPIGFGFAAVGDVIRVFDNTGKLRFSVCYGSSNPWPTTPNAGGYTLENSQFNGNQNASTSWFAGCPEGSPGVAYAPCWPVATNDVAKENYITLYPNPAKTELNIESSFKLGEVVIYDNIGRLINRTMMASNTSGQIDISGLPNGMYYLQCSSEGHVYNVKFVKAQ